MASTSAETRSELRRQLLAALEEPRTATTRNELDLRSSIIDGLMLRLIAAIVATDADLGLQAELMEHTTTEIMSLLQRVYSLEAAHPAAVTVPPQQTQSQHIPKPPSPRCSNEDGWGWSDDDDGDVDDGIESGSNSRKQSESRSSSSAVMEDDGLLAWMFHYAVLARWFQQWPENLLPLGGASLQGTARLDLLTLMLQSEVNSTQLPWTSTGSTAPTWLAMSVACVKSTWLVLEALQLQTLDDGVASRSGAVHGGSAGAAVLECCQSWAMTLLEGFLQCAAGRVEEALRGYVGLGSLPSSEAEVVEQLRAVHKSCCRLDHFATAVATEKDGRVPTRRNASLSEEPAASSWWPPSCCCSQPHSQQPSSAASDGLPLYFSVILSRAVFGVANAALDATALPHHLWQDEDSENGSGIWEGEMKAAQREACMEEARIDLQATLKDLAQIMESWLADEVGVKRTLPFLHDVLVSS